MKRLLTLILLLLPASLSAQYFGERVTEKSFERSSLFFKSHFLNTFGLQRFQNAAVGLIEDPFLDIYLNPANLPAFEKKSTLLYVDFRGDRTEAPFRDYYVDYGLMAAETDAARFAYPPYIDPRWVSQTRTEPEPVFSFGLLTYPFGKSAQNLFVGATYQIIHKDEPFYTVPSWIYNARAGYDAFENRVADVPIIDRFSGEDEMMISGHLFAAYLGYHLSPKVDLGLSLNGVIHSRDGSYLNSVRSPYGGIDPSEYEYLNQRERIQDYDHLDVSGGLRFQLSPETSAGIKVGYLSGKADQQHLSADNSMYAYGDPNNSYNESSGFNDASTTQTWKHSGATRYGRVNFSHNISDRKKLSLYFRYGESDIDLSNASTIRDTSFYTSRWEWDSSRSFYLYESSLSDIRTGSGNRDRWTHEGLVSYKWKLSEKNTVLAAVYISRDKSRIKSIEPVSASRSSNHLSYYEPSQPDTTRRYYRLTEDKTLLWNYESLNWTVQLPIMLKFHLNPNWSVLIGVNRILESWNIEEQTTAIFARRERVDDGQTKVETNFGERYTEPRRRITEDHTDLITSFEVAVSPDLKINLLVEPDFDDRFRVAQWWLGFRSTF